MVIIIIIIIIITILGKRCVIKEESVQSLEKSPILECVHKERIL